MHTTKTSSTVRNLDSPTRPMAYLLFGHHKWVTPLMAEKQQEAYVLWWHSKENQYHIWGVLEEGLTLGMLMIQKMQEYAYEDNWQEKNINRMKGIEWHYMVANKPRFEWQLQVELGVLMINIDQWTGSTLSVELWELDGIIAYASQHCTKSLTHWEHIDAATSHEFSKIHEEITYKMRTHGANS